MAIANPDLRLEVTTEDRPVDMIEEGYDLVIRVNPDQDESLVGRIFLRDRLVVVANPSLSFPEESVIVPAVVCTGGGGTKNWEIETVSGSRKILVEPVLSLSSLLMVRDAVRAGIGAARLPISLVANDLASGTLGH